MTKYIKISLTVAMLFTLLSFGESINRKNHERAKNDQQWKIGVALYSFRQSSFIGSLDKAKKAGAEYVEGFSFQKLGDDFDNRQLIDLSDTQLIKINKMISDKGLKMISMYAAAKTKAEWLKYFKIGHTLHLHFLVGEPKQEDLDFVDSLAGVYNMRLAIHDHSEGESQYWSPDSVLNALKGKRHIGACADIGHWAKSGLDAVKSLKKLDGHIISLHVKNVSEVGNVNAKWVNLDKGAIDYPAVVEELHLQGFHGIAYIENERNGNNSFDEVKSSINYLKNLRGNH